MTKTFTQNIVSYHFMNEQVLRLYDKLQRTTIELPTFVSVSTKPWCNCREMGFVLSIRGSGAQPVSNYAFYEHRNSDDICCIVWEGETPISGAVTCDDLPKGVFESKYDYTKSWKVGHDWEVIEFIKEQLEAYAQRVLAAAQEKVAS